MSLKRWVIEIPAIFLAKKGSVFGFAGRFAQVYLDHGTYGRIFAQPKLMEIKPALSY